MLAVGDLDRHFARNTRQLIGSRVRRNSDSQLWFAARHRGAVMCVTVRPIASLTTTVGSFLQSRRLSAAARVRP